jgi:hypothetical protein
MMQVERPSEGQYLMQVKWYFAPSGAKTFYGLDAFSSGIWDRDRPALPPLLGEQPPYESPWYNGKNVWGYVGQCMIGTAEQYADGLTAADLAAPPAFSSIPACCKPASVAGPAIGFTFDWPDPQFSYPVDPGFTGFRFDFLDPSPPGPGPIVELGWAFDFLDPSPPGPGPIVELGWRFDWLDPSQPPLPQDVLIGFRLDWFDPTPPGPPPRVLLGFRFDWLDPTPPGPGPLIGIDWRFDWLDPTHPGPTDTVDVGFRFDWLDPTPPGPGPLIGLGWRFDWMDPTPPGSGPLIGLDWRFDWMDPTPPGPGELVGLGWRCDFFPGLGGSIIPTACYPAGIADTMHCVISTIGPASPFDGPYLLTYNPVVSRWQFNAGGFIVYVQCDVASIPNQFVVGVIEGAVNSFHQLSAPGTPPYGTTMWSGTWPSGTFALQAVVSP